MMVSKRHQLIEELDKLGDKYIQYFMRMYSPHRPKSSIADVVNGLSNNQVKWLEIQIKNTIKQKEDRLEKILKGEK